MVLVDGVRGLLVWVVVEQGAAVGAFYEVGCGCGVGGVVLRGHGEGGEGEDLVVGWDVAGCGGHFGSMGVFP